MLSENKQNSLLTKTLLTVAISLGTASFARATVGEGGINGSTDVVYENDEGSQVLVRPDVDPLNLDYETLDLGSDELKDLFTESDLAALDVQGEGSSVSLKAHRRVTKTKRVKRTVVKPTKKVGSGSAVRIVISLSSQKMNVYVAGQNKYTWSVSTGKGGKATPRGTFKPFLMDAHYRSKEFGVVLPYGIKFEGRRGLLIHATRGSVGTAKSHGCVRLPIGAAQTLFGVVRSHGMRNTTIVIQ